MTETIYETIKDSDGVECFIKRGNLVRCKDCKHWRRLLLNRDGCGACHADNPIKVSNQDWYCADGERR